MKRDPLVKAFRTLDPTKKLTDEQLDTMFSVKELLDQLNSPKRLSWFASTRRRVWRRSVVASVIAVLMAGGVATAITLSRSPVRSVAHMACYQSTSLSSIAEVTSYGNNPLSLCAQVMHWPAPRSGVHGRGMLCVLSDGSLAAFPPSSREESCAKLGLVTFNGRLASPHVAAFQQAAESYFVHHQCDSTQDFRLTMLRLLGKFGVVGWHVQTVGSKSANACATLGFDVESKLVDVVGAPRSNSNG